MTHDPLCLLHPSDLPMNSMCSCGLIARVRSDERRQWTMMLKERTEERDEARHDAQAARASADRRRAENAALWADAAAFKAERDAARAEVAALQVFAQDANEAFASGRREVLAELRRQVEVLRVRYRDAGPAGTPAQAGYDAGADDVLSDVLTLLNGGGSDG